MVDISAIKGGQGDKSKAVKAVKFKLTKEQTAYVDELVKLDTRIATCREYIALWTNYFRYIAETLDRKEVTPEEEKGFFQIASQLSRKHFLFVELMGDCFDRGGDIINLLATGSSLAMLQGMQEQTRSKFELDWHSLFLDLNKSLGRLVRMIPGNMTLSEALASLDNRGAVPAAGAKPAKK